MTNRRLSGAAMNSASQSRFGPSKAQGCSAAAKGASRLGDAGLALLACLGLSGPVSSTTAHLTRLGENDFSSEGACQAGLARRRRNAVVAKGRAGSARHAPA